MLLGDRAASPPHNLGLPSCPNHVLLAALAHVRGKGRKIRSVPLTGGLVDALSILESIHDLLLLSEFWL